MSREAGDEMIGTHIARIDDLLAGRELAVCQVILDGGHHVIIGGGCRRRGDIRNQIRQIVIAGFGQMHLIAGLFGVTLFAVARIRVVRRTRTAAPRPGVPSRPTSAPHMPCHRAMCSLSTTKSGYS